MLVVTDTWMPGWTARVNGEPTPIYQGNLAQRVIPLVRPGRNRITMDYQAPGLALGFILTILSIFAWGIVATGSLARQLGTEAPHGPAHGSQPGAQAGRHALEGQEIKRDTTVVAVLRRSIGSRWQ